jgi:acyl transferase domain-containing protein
VVAPSSSNAARSLKAPSRPGAGDEAIAVVGLGCKFPGTDSLDEFWDLISNGKSMCSQIPEECFKLNSLRRLDESLTFWDNFVKDIDAFDHKFFKKSSREAASMDPQQRILLRWHIKR